MPAVSAKRFKSGKRDPRGRVSTYNLIAQYIGKPGSSRAVGMALAKKPFPIIIHCHRIIRSDGNLGGYQGGWQMKRSLLQMEGIAFRNDTHVAEKILYWSGQ